MEGPNDMCKETSSTRTLPKPHAKEDGLLKNTYDRGVLVAGTALCLKGNKIILGPLLPEPQAWSNSTNRKHANTRPQAQIVQTIKPNVSTDAE